MSDNQPPSESAPSWLVTFVQGILIVVEYAIVASLLLIAGTVLVRTVVSFFRQWNGFPETVVSAIDGVLVVIILVDIAHTVLSHLRSSTFPVRPFLVIGILAGVRDILSASARLTFGSSLQGTNFTHTVISLSLGVGVVVMLSLAMVLLHINAKEPSSPPGSNSS
jgi:uncharacterized membrane protein (DUF373 family)